MYKRNVPYMLLKAIFLVEGESYSAVHMSKLMLNMPHFESVFRVTDYFIILSFIA